MKTSVNYIDFIYSYPGLWKSPSKCGLKIIEKTDKIIVIATELYGDNPGSSVTECNTQLAADICAEKNIDPQKLVFIEHTPDRGSKLSCYDETFFMVHFDWDGTKFVNPRWEEKTKAEVDNLIR
ncbi:MAG: hypothetical protein V1904_14905 [Bacteroidota bacterium]